MPFSRDQFDENSIYRIVNQGYTTSTGRKTSIQKQINVLTSPQEKCRIVNSSAGGVINFDILDSAILYYTGNASSNHTLNFRGNSVTTLNSLLEVGDSISTVWLNTNGGAAWYPSVIQVDGSTVIPRWSGGIQPTTGNALSIDVYSFSIIKIAATPTYTVLAGQTRFA